MHFEVLQDEPVHNDLCMLVFCTSEEDNVKVRGPLFELAHPIMQSCGQQLDTDRRCRGGIEGRRGNKPFEEFCRCLMERL